MELALQIVGSIGAFLILAAYYLVSHKHISAQGKSYHLLNLIGAAGVAFNVFYFRAWPSLVLNIFWGLIALLALLKRKNK